MKKMSAIIDFFLFWSPREPNWDKVESEYGHEEMMKAKLYRDAYRRHLK